MTTPFNRHIPCHYGVSEPRFVICNEDETPRNGFSIYEIEFYGADGWLVDWVWARSSNEARMYAHMHGIHNALIAPAGTMEWCAP